MNKKCFEVSVKGLNKNTYSEYIFAMNFEEAKIIAQRQGYGANIIKIAEAELYTVP